MNVLSNAKRLTALILCAVLLLGLMPLGAFAAEAEGETTAPTGETTAPIAETTAPTDETTAPAEEEPQTTADEPTAQAEGDGTVTIPGSATTVENVYVLTNTLSNEGTYLIVNTNAAGSGYALLNNNGTISAVAVTVVQSDNGPYIKLDNAGAVWTATGSDTSWAFANSGSYLGYTSSSSSSYGVTSYTYALALATNSTAWTLNENTLYNYLLREEGWFDDSYSNYYLTGGESWSMSRTSANVYFYAPAESVTVTVPDITYGITVSANGTTDAYTAQYVTAETTLALTAAFQTTPAGYEGNLTGGTYAWTSGNTEVATVAEDGTLTFTGKGGTTTVRVTYTQDGYEIWDEIVITAEPAGYKLQIVDAEDNSLDGIITVKGEAAIAAGLDLDALVSYETSADNSVEVTSAVVVWTVSDESIASIDSDGKLTFGDKEGVITVTATYTDPEGNVYTDAVNVSVSKSEYFTPNDGTNDFPEYPNEGAIRIDKTAQAVGNFSETGMAKVELSMTGVPYSTNNEIDVVIMVDMSTSMLKSSNEIADRVTPAKNAVIAALNAIVKNEDGSYNNNRVAIYTFAGSLNPNSNGYCNLQTFDADAVASMTTKINNWKTDSATNYKVSLEKCQTVLEEAKTDGTGNNRQQFCIFITDGSPSSGFAYLNDQGGVTAMDIYENFTDAEVGSTFVPKTEYYSYKMKQDNVGVYTIGVQMFTKSGNSTVESTNCKTLLKQIAGTKDGDATTTANAGYARFVESDVSVLTTIFQDIVNEIKQAATNVTVYDVITDKYSLVLDVPAGVTLPDGTALTIDVTEYTLDSDKNRVLPGKVLESVAVNDTDKVTIVDGKITAINADTFTYDAATNSITWKVDQVSNTELALSYYVYLEGSAGSDEEIAAGTYPTNEYAYVTYTNHLDHPCKKYFPVPQLTWNGAQVSYTFYLVNAQGQPVNRAGRVIPFNEAIYVTDLYTESVTWDTDEAESLSAEMIAKDLLPEVYTLYDPNTTYTINVYEDAEGEDLGNHFIIEAEKQDSAGNYTTKVFNTKAGTIYSAPGTYNAVGGEDITKVYTGFDFANTTVAFAVVWNATLAADTVVIDFGLPVSIDLTTNDTLKGVVQGITATKPGIVADSGTSTERMTSEDELDLKYGTAKLEGASVIYTPDTMAFIDPEVFYYESQVEFYNSSNVLTQYYMYSTVTVIPATTIYYEDEYVTLKTIEVAYVEEACAENSGKTYYILKNGAYTPISNPVVGETYYVPTETVTDGWPVDSVASDAMQDQDRPGESKISEDLDSDNNYGYDSAYETLSEYSLGGAAKINVNANTRGEAYFTFYGTGFDVIGLTSNTTGALTVQVYKGSEASGSAVKTLFVDTYYGYTLNDAGEWVIEANEPNALYQVPVMKITGLDYAMYTVKITAGYNSYFDHNTANAGYDLYLDAVRIYDPTGNQNEDANDAYVADGEGWPQYIELRDHIIEAAGITTAEDGTVTFPEGAALPGAVFIDGTDEPTIAEYVSYGPNNELYLAQNQSIAFNVTINELIADIQLGVKVGNGGPITYTINGDEFTVNTTTDMYYSILEYAKNADGEATTVTITNTSGGILSLTNIKITYTEDPAAASAVATLYIDEEAATAAVMSLRKAPVVEEPEVTEPEVTEPEATEPETTVPEETEPEETEPSEDEVVEEVVKVVEKIVKKFFGWIFG